MVELSAEQFAQRAFDLNLLDERQLQEIWGQLGSRQVSGDEFQQFLLRRELLTNYQTERLLRGDRTGFFYDDYKVLYLIGTGTFARVYRASHKTTGEIVALKVLRRRFAEDPEQADRFYREGEMGATLKHPNIVPIMQVVSEGDTHFLVMKFIEGRNLREFIKIRKKFEPAQATHLVADVANGLSYAFERGICHRDLKMSNVLVSSRGQAMLVDFGLAAADKNLSDDALANNPNPRTIDYAGLERATGVRKDDPRSDLYFLGCHLLPHADWKPADLRNARPHSAAQQEPLPGRDPDYESRAGAAAAHHGHRESGHGNESQRSLSVARRDAGRSEGLDGEAERAVHAAG